MVASRNLILDLLGEPRIWNEQKAAPYQRGSSPLKDGSKAAALEELLRDFDSSQEQIVAALAKKSVADLERRIAGKAGAIQ
ncbi:MAG: hypothetical protein ACE5HO_01450 [bacterium]